MTAFDSGLMEMLGEKQLVGKCKGEKEEVEEIERLFEEEAERESRREVETSPRRKMEDVWERKVCFHFKSHQLKTQPSLKNLSC